MRVRTVVTAVAMLACMAAAARGQVCDTHEQCMANGMCMSDGTCQGTPVTGGNCDLVSDALCMVNGHCVNGTCMGEPAPDGTSCAGGCGTCQPIVPGVPFSTCTADPAQRRKGVRDQPGRLLHGGLSAVRSTSSRNRGVPSAAEAVPRHRQQSLHHGCLQPGHWHVRALERTAVRSAM